MERVSSFEHRGTPMILIDFSGMGPKEILPTIDAAAAIIRARPAKSVSTITKVSGASFDGAVIDALKEFAKSNEPHVRASAIVGLTGLQRIVLMAVSSFTGRSFLLCDSVEAARDRLNASV